MAMSSEKEILAIEDQRFAAMIARDFAALEKLVHDQLLYTHSSGVTDTKASWLDSMKSGKVKYKSANCSERQVRFFGDTAFIRGKAAIEAEIGGQPRSLKLLFLNAWVRTPQGWKFAAWQSCPQPS
jgi:ketosteroid isomerase-like protein